jgi:tRNA threonylcarbamoyladenosine biosynthesis protein TsaE
MNSQVMFEVQAVNVGATVSVAERIGAQLRGGEVIELVSDVGGGKTTFVQGLARGMGSTDRVSSPSFTLSNEYRAGELRLYHFDFYRLQEPGIMANELGEVVTDAQAVVVVEWADIVEGVLPRDRLRVYITVTGEESRKLTISYPKSLAYLIKDVA